MYHTRNRKGKIFYSEQYFCRNDRRMVNTLSAMVLFKAKVTKKAVINNNLFCCFRVYLN